MLTGKQIAGRISEARCDTDLGLIYGIWPEQDHCNDVMRSSDYLAIRKAVAALDRLGDALARRMASNVTADYRVLPEIKPTTRVRKTPQRLWLEIDLAERRGEWSTRAVLFAEFSKKGVRFGIRLPTDGAPLGKRTIKTLRHYNCAESFNATGWQLEHRAPPAEQRACSSDINTWLAGRSKANQRKTVPLVLNKTSTDNRPFMKTLVEAMSNASILMSEVMAIDMNQKSPVPAEQKASCAELI